MSSRVPVPSQNTLDIGDTVAHEGGSSLGLLAVIIGVVAIVGIALFVAVRHLTNTENEDDYELRTPTMPGFPIKDTETAISVVSSLDSALETNKACWQT